jgi:two-component system, LytTR family, response regulator
MKRLRLLIVDDEPLIREAIRRGLAALPDTEIVGECESGGEAISAIHSRAPDLVLLDIQMPDLTGLEVVHQLGPQHMPPVIFITAYDEFAVKAFELNAVDYILKPFDDERLVASINRARERVAARSNDFLAERLQSLIETQRQKWPERIVVRNGERFDIVVVDSIDWVESANNYVELHCGPKQHLLSETLTSLETRLDPGRFLRIHRCRIVNISRIAVVHALLGGSYELELRGGTRLTSGRQYKDAIRALIKIQVPPSR